jgi:asparagine synthase (glutamine-hydrolysing)
MCGITVAWAAHGTAPGTAEAMTACVAHRGPDARGTWRDERAGLTLGHARLAVLDLSEAGAQPMMSASGRYVVVFNGELYDHLDLRRELERSGRAPVWRGTSDTETLLAGVEALGLRAVLARTGGMSALALWDREAGTLTLARDRMGEKPLVYARTHGSGGATLLAASQSSALEAGTGFRPDVDPIALTAFLRHGVVPGTATIRSGVVELPPGHLLTLRAPDDPAEPEAWWSLAETVRTARADPFRGGDVEAIELLEDTLRVAVQRQTIADVPLGAFLSGGIDSSTVVALLAQVADGPVRTFTIGSDDAMLDESAHARRVAAHLGTEHTELRLGEADVLALVPELPRVYDEPFADPSQLPTLLVSRLARAHVTVALSGDGGDELFGGYSRYDALERQLRVPAAARRAVAPLAGASALTYAARDVPARLRGGGPHPRTARRVGIARDLWGGDAALARRAASLNPDDHRLVLGMPPGGRSVADQDARRAWRSAAVAGDVRGRAMLLDATGYLPDDILAKVDRAAMSVALETRIPLLDHRVVALAWRLGPHLRVRDGVSKWVLREVLARHVPRALFERPKAGFGVPIGAWLRGPLRPWAEDLLSPAALRRQGSLDVARVRALWEEHRDGRSELSHALWPVLGFAAWHESHRG